ncbi:MAG TPA: hypothetical protein VJ020_12300 [Anaerolineales bacterium]|nr:hypothetical protein [Anaerolineales bacterium]
MRHTHCSNQPILVTPKSNYADLVNTLPTDKLLTLLIYPPNHAEVLTPIANTARPNVSVIPIGDSWPIEETARHPFAR